MLLLVALIASIVTGAAQSVSLTDQQIVDAIAHQKEADKSIVWVGRRGAGNFTIAVTGPRTRIGIAALMATKQFRPFTVSDVEESARQSVWIVNVLPEKPAIVLGTWAVTPPAADVLIQRHGATDIADVIRPVKLTLDPEAWSNAMGAKFEGRGATATFDASLLPPGDIDIVVTTNANPRRYQLSAKDRLRIQ
jgi:hypothetical protein